MADFLRVPGSPVDVALEQRSSGNIEAAIETLLQAAGDSLADSGIAVTLGKMLAETGQDKRAEHWLRHAIKLAPDDLVVRLAWGGFLGQSGRTAEAMALLSDVRTEAHEMIADPTLEEFEELEALLGFIASTEVNLARVAFESGDSGLARELARPSLTNEELWGAAHAVYADVLDRDGLDPKQLAEECLAMGQVSPYMVCHLLEILLHFVPPPPGYIPIPGSLHGGYHLVVGGKVRNTWYPKAKLYRIVDFLALDDLVGRADECLNFDWRKAAPELETVMELARKTFLEGVMCSRVVAADYPNLAPLLSPPVEFVSVDEIAADAEPQAPATKPDLITEEVHEQEDWEDEEDEEDEVKYSVEAGRYGHSLMEWDRHDPQQWTIRERLVGLATAGSMFTPEDLARMAAREPLATTLLPDGVTKSLTSTPPDLSVTAFIRLGVLYGWVTPHFSWMDWYGTAEARRWFDEPATIVEEASVDGLVRLMTTLIRGERFSENSLHYAIECGFVYYLFRRAAVLIEELDQGVDLPVSLFANALRPIPQ